MNELIEWLESGVQAGHITHEQAFNWVAKKADCIPSTVDGPLVSVPITKDIAPYMTTGKAPRLKKDGTPWGKPGRKPKQTELPVDDE